MGFVGFVALIVEEDLAAGWNCWFGWGCMAVGQKERERGKKNHEF